MTRDKIYNRQKNMVLKSTWLNFSQSLNGQSLAGGDSGQNTKSASLARAAATDKYLQNIHFSKIKSTKIQL